MSAPTRLDELLNLAVAGGLTAIRVALPGRVESYDAGQQLAAVQPLLKERRIGEDGAEEAVSLPVLPSVPVIFPGGGGFRVTFPVAKGDTVLLVFTDRSLDLWLEQGGEVDPIDLRRHHLSDAVAIPILHPKKGAWTGAAADAVTIGQDGGTQVTVRDGAIELAGADEAVAMAESLETLLGQVRTWLSTHTHPTAVGSSGPPAQAPALPPIGELGSSVAKVKR